MTAFLLFPGELVSNMVGLAPDSDNRLILRMFTNTLVWGSVGVAAVLAVML